MNRLLRVFLRASASPRQCTFLFILTLSAADTPWLTYGGNYSGWRYSELSQINTTNVARLAPRWIFQTKVPGNQETSPIVRDGVMYLTAPSNHAFALDLRTGQPIWHYSTAPPKPLGLCCGEVNRGFGIAGKRLFKVNIENTLVALDAATGQVLWEKELGEFRKGFSGTLAPLVIKDKVLVGLGGAEFGTRASGEPTRFQLVMSRAVRRGRARPRCVWAAPPGLPAPTIRISTLRTGAQA